MLASTDENLPGKIPPRRASLSQLVRRSLLHQVTVLLAPRNPQLWEVDYPFRNNGKPFAEVRVVVDSALLVAEIRSGLHIWGINVLVALVVSAFLAAMVSRIRFLRTPESS